MKKILTTACIMFLATNVFAKDLNDEYPKTLEEKCNDEMGSVLGGEGIVVRPKSSNIAEGIVPAEGGYNKFLWQAAQEMADVAPLSLVDSKNGELSTDWYSLKNTPNTSAKLIVKITGSKLSSESLNVKVQQRTMKNGSWIEEEAHSKVASDMSAKILKRAKDLANN